jgi:hypothetical protein
MLSKLNISPNFTIDDIHKIREANYECTKDMTNAEKIAYYSEQGKRAEERINKKRALVVH